MDHTTICSAQVKSLMSRDANQRLTLARLARGLSVAVGPVSLLILVLLPVIFFIPLLTTRFWFFSQMNITLAHAACDLFQIDKFLFSVVVAFGILLPFLKTTLTVLCWYHFEISTVERHLEILSYIAKFSMLDVMLVAFFLITFKSVGIGTVRVTYGLYAYALLVIGSLVLNLVMIPVARRIRLQQSAFVTSTLETLAAL